MDVSDNLNMTVSSEIDNIIRSLVANSDIIFKSQQRGDSELDASEKTDIALETFNQNKTNFLMKFGKYLGRDQLDFFDQFTKDYKEIELILQDLKANKTKKHNIQVKNRRYEALQQMSKENSYFSEIEMMKRNPLLYEHLVGQYLSEEEKRERDKYEMKEDVTLVNILMEGMERNKAELTKQLQQQREDCQMEESDSSDEERDVEEISVSVKSARPSTSRWGEFEEHNIQTTKSKKSTPMVTPAERHLLKEEFISTMHQNFVEGKDSDYFDYSTVDDNSSYDNITEMDQDAEAKYFDSEDPDEDEIRDYESSEDELDIYMNALNQNAAVCQLAKSIDEKL